MLCTNGRIWIERSFVSLILFACLSLLFHVFSFASLISSLNFPLISISLFLCSCCLLSPSLLPLLLLISLYPPSLIRNSHDLFSFHFLVSISSPLCIIFSPFLVSLLSLSFVFTFHSLLPLPFLSSVVGRLLERMPSIYMCKCMCAVRTSAQQSCVYSDKISPLILLFIFTDAKTAAHFSSQHDFPSLQAKLTKLRTKHQMSSNKHMICAESFHLLIQVSTSPTNKSLLLSF